MKHLQTRYYNIYLKSIGTYQEWWRDWPEETQQPVNFIELLGAKSCSVKAGR